MAVLSKADLRAAIDITFASMRNIPAANAKARFLDWIDSLLAPASIVPGAGITVSTDADGAVTIAAGGAAAAVGIPSFVPSGAAQPSAAVLTASIAGLAASPPFPSLVYLLTPNDLDRAADDLEMQINGDVSRVRPVIDFRGDPLKARDMDPGALYEILAHASPTQVYRLTEPIPVRRQDWGIVVGWVDGPRDPPPLLTAAVVATGTSFLTSEFVFPDYTGSETFTWLFFGVPTDAPPVVEARNVHLNSVLSFTETGDAFPVGGVIYRWYRGGARTRPNNNLHRFSYGPYT